MRRVRKYTAGLMPSLQGDEMENVLDCTLFQEELCFYGLSSKDAWLIRSKEGVIVARVSWGDGTAVLKCFENPAFRREIQNYGILHSCGIPTITVLGKSDRSILLEDIDSSETYRLGMEQDLNEPAVIKSIAKWYKTLHTNGRQYVQQYGSGMYEEWDCFTRENIEGIRDKFDLTDSEGLKALMDYYGELRKRIEAAPRTLTYNDFYYTNLVVKKDASEAMMFDYNLLGKGNPASDLRNVTYWFSEENKKLFFSVYGEVDDRLLLLDQICAPVVSLYFAMSKDVFPDWAKEAIDELDDIPKLVAELSA